MQLMNVEEVAAWSRHSRAGLLRQIHMGRLSAHRVGRRYLMTLDAVREWSGFESVTREDILAAYQFECAQTHTRRSSLQAGGSGHERAAS